MTVAGGLSAQLGLKAEGTPGTAVVVDRFLEFNSESLKQSIERIESAGLRPAQRVAKSTARGGWLPGRVGVEGDVEMEVHGKGFGVVLEHMLGSVDTTQPDDSNSPTVYEHFATVGALDGKALTIQVGRTGVDGTTRPFTYAGCKVTEWELSCEVNGILMLKLTLDGVSETTGTALASASYPTASIPLVFTGATISIAGTDYDAKNFSLQGNNALTTDRYFMRGAGSATKKEQLEGAGMREYTGTISADFTDLTAYNRFVNGTEAAVTANFEGGIIEDALTFALEVNLPAVRFDGETPNVGGPELIEQSLPIKVVDGADADGPVQLTYRTSDATA